MAALVHVRLTLESASTQAVVAAVTGKRVIVTSFNIGCSATTALPSFEDTTGTPVVLAGPWTSTSPIGMNGTRESPVMATATGKGLTFRTAGAGLCNGILTYYLGD